MPSSPSTQQKPEQNRGSNNANSPSTPKRLDTSRLAPFDKDIRDDCIKLQLHCTSEVFAHVYLQCPASCTKLLEEEGMKGTVESGLEDYLYEQVETLQTRQGKRISTDRFEGSIIVLGIVPLLPGMAVYFYELMEHLHSIYGKKGTEFVLLPIDQELGIHIQERHSLGKKQGVVVLEEQPASLVENHPWIKHLLSVQPRSGAVARDDYGIDLDDRNDDQSKAAKVHQTPLHTDRVTFYIVSADGYFVERVISPSMALLQKKVSTYLKTVDYEL